MEQPGVQQLGGVKERTQLPKIACVEKSKKVTKCTTVISTHGRRVGMQQYEYRLVTKHPIESSRLISKR